LDRVRSAAELAQAWREQCEPENAEDAEAAGDCVGAASVGEPASTMAPA
jgi:hypothetical protein